MTALLVIATIVFLVGVDFVHVKLGQRKYNQIIIDEISGMPCMADGKREDE
jgi:hypothetical protein